ncbi:hypothetical protein OB952_21895 [Aeromonas salmonicida]|nr:hypothetical protein [Aeromonas salmonicida]MDM5069987.1 hypothetical protein [Aeromonas salmonicida]
MLEVNRSSYCAFSRKQQGQLRLRAKVLALHQASRGEVQRVLAPSRKP